MSIFSWFDHTGADSVNHDSFNNDSFDSNHHLDSETYHHNVLDAHHTGLDSHHHMESNHHSQDFGFDTHHHIEVLDGHEDGHFDYPGGHHVGDYDYFDHGNFDTILHYSDPLLHSQHYHCNHLAFHNPDLVHVDGYMKSDGTLVAGHVRTVPDGIEENNFSYHK